MIGGCLIIAVCAVMLLIGVVIHTAGGALAGFTAAMFVIFVLASMKGDFR